MSFLMENSTHLLPPMAIDLCKNHPYFLLGDMIWRIGAFFCVVLGIPGHVLVITIMFNSRNRRQPICLYFAVIAVCEFIYLIIVFWLWCSSLSILRDPRDVLTCGTFYSLTIGSSHASTLLLTAASIDRVLIVVSPGSYLTFVTRTKALMKISVILLVVLILMIQYYVSFFFSYSRHICEYYSYAQLWYSTLWPLIRLCLLAFVPCLITCICSILIFQNRFYRRPSTTSETSGSRHMRTASVLLVIYSIYYTVSIMPINILQFFHSYFLNDNQTDERAEIDCTKYSQWKLLMRFCMLLMAINSANKFLVHYLISLQFRQDVANLFTKCKLNIDEPRRRTRSNETSYYR